MVGTGVATSVGAAISTLSASADVDLEVVNCWIKGTGRRGIRLGRTAGGDGSRNRGRVDGNLVTGVVTAVQFIFVGQIAGASWTGVVRGNHLKGNNNGLVIERNTTATQTAGNAYDISSEMNLYEKNAWGVFMPSLFGSFEQTRFRSVQDTIVDSSLSRGIVPNTLSGGIGAGLTAGTSCYTRIEILNATFANNLGRLGPLDFGVQPDAPSATIPQSSTNNVFELLIRGVTASGVDGSWKVIPSNPNLGNEVRLIGSDVALQNSNDSIPITFVETD